MELKELGKAIVKYGAPLLGFAVAGKGGAAVANEIMHRFGVTNTDDLIAQFAQDPEITFKLKSIESDERIRLEELATQKLDTEINAEISDRASARELAKVDSTARNLAYILIISSIAFLFYLPFSNPDAAEKELMAAIGMLLIKEAIDSVRLFFGRSFRKD